MLVEISNRTKSRINLSLVRRVAEKFLQHYKQKQEVSLVFVGDTAMQKLNRIWRGKNCPTDVLSFREKESEYYLGDFLGEILIDYQQIKRQAKAQKHSVQQEEIFILVHGLLHLVGYDDATERGAKKMDQLAKRFIAKL